MKIIKTAKIKLAENVYSNNVEVNILSPGDSWYVEDNDPSIRVPFTMHMDIREWGIKEINIVPQGMSQINYLVVFPDGSEKEQVVQVDFSKIKVDLSEGHHWTLNDLWVILDNQGNVDYNKSYFEGTFIGNPI